MHDLNKVNTKKRILQAFNEAKKSLHLYKSIEKWYAIKFKKMSVFEGMPIKKSYDDLVKKLDILNKYLSHDGKIFYFNKPNALSAIEELENSLKLTNLKFFELDNVLKISNISLEIVLKAINEIEQIQCTLNFLNSDNYKDADPVSVNKKLEFSKQVSAVIKTSKENIEFYDKCDFYYKEIVEKDFLVATKTEMYFNSLIKVFNEFVGSIGNSKFMKSDNEKSIEHLIELIIFKYESKFHINEISEINTEIGISFNDLAVKVERLKHKLKIFNLAKEMGFDPSGSDKQKRYAMDIIKNHLLTEDFIEMFDDKMNRNDPIFKEYFLHLLRMSSKWWIEKANYMDMELYRMDWCNERSRIS